MSRHKRILKICRVIDSLTASHLVRLEVDLLGFHLIAEDSDFAAMDIIGAAKNIKTAFNYGGNCVLTKSTSVSFIKRVLNTEAFSYLQVHTQINAEELSAIRELCDETSVKLITMFDPSKNSSSYYEAIKMHSDLLLFDQTLGGTGRPLESRYLDQYRGQRFLLAGGINSENIEERMRLYDPAGFDIQSSVERTKGKKRFGIIRDIRRKLDPGFPSAVGVHRHSEIYYSATDAPLQRLSQLMSALASAIDGVHLDHSTGFFDQRYIRNSLECATILGEIAPEMPYDLHLFVPAAKLLSTVDEYLAANENILRVWIPVEMSAPASSTELFELTARLREKGIRPGISILSNSIPHHIQDLVREQVTRNDVSEVCVVGLALEKSASAYAQGVGSTLRYLRILSQETNLPLWYLVDRGVTEERLEKLYDAGIRALTIGRALTESADPRSLAERVRRHLGGTNIRFANESRS